MRAPRVGPAALNEACNPRPCAAGLVCTGAGETWFCRSGCRYDAGVCADGQSCGRPIIAGVTEPTAPRACLASGWATKFGSCAELPCPDKMYCIKADQARYCFPRCALDADCASGELCTAVVQGAKLCMKVCTAASPACPTDFTCAGVGPYPTDLCAPVTVAAPGAPCDSHPCPAGQRCNGPLDQPHYCYPTCPQGTCAGATEVCADLGSGHLLCYRACGLFTGGCAGYEVCLPNPLLSKTHCAPGSGTTGDCTNAHCVSSMLCVDHVCRPACDQAHPCASGTCTGTNYEGKALPWSSCK